MKYLLVISLFLTGCDSSEISACKFSKDEMKAQVRLILREYKNDRIDAVGICKKESETVGVILKPKFNDEWFTWDCVNSKGVKVYTNDR